MQRSPTSLLKQSHIRARTVVMPSLTLSSSCQVEGSYQFAEIDRFYGWPNIPLQPMQTSLVKNYPQISSNSDHSYGPARKKRLTMDQTKSLECSFAMDNKLEPERKKKLALELGLQPRQVAIWYQNRRARTKTKHLEEKYETLNMHYQDVLKEKKKLEAEVNKLREELLGFKEKKGDKPDSMQGGNSTSSTNNEEASFSTMEVKQQQLYVQGKSNQPVYSENNSSESARNRSTFSTNSPAHDRKFDQANGIIIKQVFEPQGMLAYAQQEESCPPNHEIFAYSFDNQLHHHHQQQQQQELLQHFQHQYQLSCFRNIVGDVKLGNLEYLAIPSASLAQFDGNHFLDDHRFKLEEEAAQYLELATQA